MPVALNQKGHRTVVRCTTTETFALSDLKATDEDTVVGAHITKVAWSGTVAIARGASTLLNLSGSGVFDFRELGIPLKEGAGSNVVVTITGTGTAIVELTKLY